MNAFICYTKAVSLSSKTAFKSLFDCLLRCWLTSIDPVYYSSAVHSRNDETNDPASTTGIGESEFPSRRRSCQQFDQYRLNTGDQPSNPISDLGEHISSAISNAVSVAVEQGLQDVSLTNQAVLAFSAMSKTIGQTVAAAIKSSIEDLGPKPIVMDAIALREQTLGTSPPHPPSSTSTDRALSQYESRPRSVQR